MIQREKEINCPHETSVSLSVGGWKVCTKCGAMLSASGENPKVSEAAKQELERIAEAALRDETR